MAGSDADLTNIQYVAQGKQAVEIWKKIKPLAETAAEMAVKVAKGEVLKGDMVLNNGFTDVTTVVTPVVAVNKDNIDSTIIAGGFYTKEQVYGK